MKDKCVKNYVCLTQKLNEKAYKFSKESVNCGGQKVEGLVSLLKGNRKRNDRVMAILLNLMK